MEIVDQTKFAIGIGAALIGLAILFFSRGSRGFERRRQTGALFLIAAAVFVARGLGLIDF